MMRNPDPAAAENVGWIDDLLTQILVHLPWKPLVPLKTVSKHWNSIISHPSFLNRKHSTNRATGLFFQIIYRNRHSTNSPPPRVQTRVVSFSSSSSSPPQTLLLPDSLRIFHSCNGLLVLKHTKSATQFYVYNPTTNQIKTTKDLGLNDRPQDRVVGMYLAFNPAKSPHYKVVCVWQLDWATGDNKHIQYQFEVYSSETGSWETRGGYNTTNYYHDDFENGVYWNGAIHWFRLSICFNPDDDHDDEMPMPAPRHESRGYYFGESCGHLHCAFYGCDPDESVYVYEMRRDYSEWFLKYSSRCCLPNNIRRLHCVVRGDKDEDDFLVFTNDAGETIRYDLVHKTCQIIPDKAFDIPRNGFVGYQTKSFQYIESPCSV